MSRADRLLRLVQILRRYRQPVSAQALADELTVSVRSVYRDVQTLREEGATIEGEPGVGYVLRPGSLLPPLMFSDDELEALVLGLRLTVEHADEALGRAATDVVAKLRAVLPKDLRTVVDETALLAGPALARPPEQIEIAEVRRTIREQRKARIAYTSERGAGSERVIWPLGLGFFQRARVLVAWCEERADFRSFRTDRIARWETLAARLPRSRVALLREWRERERIPARSEHPHERWEPGRTDSIQQLGRILRALLVARESALFVHRVDMNRRWLGCVGCEFEVVISRLFRRPALLRHTLAALCVSLLVACVSGVSIPEGEGTGGATVNAAGAGNVGQGAASNVAGAAGAAPVAGAGPVSGGAPGAGGSPSVEECNYPAWVAKKPYVKGDKVVYLGKGYIATDDNPGYDPTVSTFFWSVVDCQPIVGAGGSTSGGAGATGAAGAPSTVGCSSLDRLMPNGSASFDQMFQPPWEGHVAKSLYAYSALCAAINSRDEFKPFANSGDLQKDKRELAAFFAHVAKETAFLEQTDEAQQASNAADFHGRGAIQITGYANYAAAGQFLHKDLTGNPGLVSTDPQTNWQSALWFWMVNYNPGTAGVQNCHQAILGGDFGQTTRIINGGIECPGSQSAKDRAQYFKNDCMVISVDPGSALVC